MLYSLIFYLILLFLSIWMLWRGIQGLKNKEIVAGWRIRNIFGYGYTTKKFTGRDALRVSVYHLLLGLLLGVLLLISLSGYSLASLGQGISLVKGERCVLLCN